MPNCTSRYAAYRRRGGAWSNMDPNGRTGFAQYPAEQGVEMSSARFF
jgi:hypothetical protein